MVKKDPNKPESEELESKIGKTTQSQELRSGISAEFVELLDDDEVEDSGIGAEFMEWLDDDEVEDMERKIMEGKALDDKRKERRELLESLPKVEGCNFEKINLLSGIDENKLAELQQADLVLVYRDNNRYSDMSSSLKGLVEHKYGGKVYCVSIPQGTEELKGKDMELLKNILNTCHCMTDNTISKWTGSVCPKFEDYEYTCKDSQKFLGIIEKLEKKFEEKGIDTVYVYISSKFTGDFANGDISYPCTDHGSMYQREDGGVYYNPSQMPVTKKNKKIGKEQKLKLEEIKRFRKNRFPNLKVEFIENHLIDYDKGELEDLSGYKSEGAILIADRHCGQKTESLKCKKIFYAGNTFEPNRGIEDFVDENDAKYVGSAGEALAESILLDTISGKNK